MAVDIEIRAFEVTLGPVGWSLSSFLDGGIREAIGGPESRERKGGKEQEGSMKNAGMQEKRLRVRVSRRIYARQMRGCGINWRCQFELFPS